MSGEDTSRDLGRRDSGIMIRGDVLERITSAELGLDSTQSIPAPAPLPRAKDLDDTAFSTDPLRMYLRRMGGVSLLTREGEVEMARRIERGELRILAALREPGLRLEELSELISRGDDEEGAPAGTRAFALIVHDPDAPRGDWVHWVLYDLAPDTHALAEGASDGGRSGENDFGRLGWGGPSPPPGAPHHYVFELVALDAKLDLRVGATRDELERAIRGHELARAKLIGKYGRARR